VYTQCPDCATVFRITAEALRAAQGDVRCGVCSTTFNALENLSEQAFKAAPEGDAPSPDDSMTVEELPGGESIELSSPVELAAVPDEPPPPPAAASPDDEARAMEFHGDAADLDRLFVVENPELASFDPGAVAANLAVAEPPVDLDSTDEHPILVLDESDEADGQEAGESIVLETLPSALEADSEQAPEPAARTAAEPAAPPQVSPAATGVTAPRILIPDEMRRRLAQEAKARAEAAREFADDETDTPGLLDQRWPWVAAAGFLALLLVLQVVHAARNDLVRNEAIGPALAGTYALLGLSVLAPTDVAAYELRQWGAASDPREANRLMLRASIVNRASYAQPLPLLRLTLQDRFGGTLGQRDIGPADYLPGSGASGLLGPGQRADALIRIVDPGSEAVGFELDVCLPARGGVRCANQIKTARQ
jgi:predicted Zn finger-like uncharacterized protein